LRLNFLRRLLIGSALVVPGAAWAQSGILNTASAQVPSDRDTGVGFSAGSVIVAPIPSSSPTFGAGLALGAGYLFTLPGAKPSFAGLGAFRAENGSEAFGLGGKIGFAGGRWTLQAYVAEADIFYTLGLNELSLPLNQTGQLGRIGATYNITQKLSFGAALNYLDTDVAVDEPGKTALPEALALQANLEFLELELSASYDSRNDSFYPTFGSVVDLTLSSGGTFKSLFDGQLNLSDVSYEKLVVKATLFVPVRQDGVLAGSVVVCGASRGTPFFNLCGLGLTDAMRGFSATENLAQYTASAQVEYRGRFNERFGYVFFAGGGGRGADLSDAFAEGGGAAAGLGLRIRLSKAFELDYAVDVARDDSGEDFLYISVGQRF
jgi:outer membrane protein assembly factor BamA